MFFSCEPLETLIFFTFEIIQIFLYLGSLNKFFTIKINSFNSRLTVVCCLLARASIFTMATACKINGWFFVRGRWEERKGWLNWFFPHNNTLYTLGNYVFLCMSNFFKRNSRTFLKPKIETTFNSSENFIKNRN